MHQFGSVTAAGIGQPFTEAASQPVAPTDSNFQVKPKLPQLIHRAPSAVRQSKGTLRYRFTWSLVTGGARLLHAARMYDTTAATSSSFIACPYGGMPYGRGLRAVPGANPPLSTVRIAFTHSHGASFRLFKR